MDFGRRISWIGVALGVVLAIGVPSTRKSQSATVSAVAPAKA